MKTNRSLLVYILLTIITCGIYSLYFWYKFAQDMNTVCNGDGRHTRGILARILFSILTLGIYDLFWLYGAGDRINLNCQRKSIPCSTTGGGVLCWYIFGALIVIGPLVAVHKLMHGLNDLCAAYNAGARGSAGGATININVNPNSF